MSDVVLNRSGAAPIVFVLWSAEYGGTESLFLSLATQMRKMGIDVGFVLIGAGEGPIVARMKDAGLPHTCLGLSSGKGVVMHPRSFARAVAAFDAKGVLLPGDGYIAAALRVGGFRGRIVSVQNGRCCNDLSSRGGHARSGRSTSAAASGRLMPS